jgi:hypothetical protein
MDRTHWTVTLASKSQRRTQCRCRILAALLGCRCPRRVRQRGKSSGSLVANGTRSSFCVPVPVLPWLRLPARFAALELRAGSRAAPRPWSTQPAGGATDTDLVCSTMPPTDDVVDLVRQNRCALGNAAVLAPTMSAALSQIPQIARYLHDAARIVQNCSASSLRRLSMSFTRTTSASASTAPASAFPQGSPSRALAAASHRFAVATRAAGSEPAQKPCCPRRLDHRRHRFTGRRSVR